MDNKSISLYVFIDKRLQCAYLLTKKQLCLTDTNLNTNNETDNSDNTKNEAHNLSGDSRKICGINTNISFVKPIVEELNNSKCYRNGVFNNLSKILRQHVKHFDGSQRTFALYVRSVDSYTIDYAWGWRLWRQCHLGLERECAAAWLSTLGGAFSALGDYSNKCAKMALRISMQQIRLSIIGGDPDGVARGWLFLALALSQLGHGRAAFRLLHAAYNTPTYDDRHRCMCLGVQAKLKYDRKMRHQNRENGRGDSGDTLEQTLKSIML